MRILSKANLKKNLVEMIKTIKTDTKDEAILNLMKTFEELLKFKDLKKDEIEDIKKQVLTFRNKLDGWIY